MLSGTVPAVVADWRPVAGVSVAEVLRRLLRLAAVVLASYGAYALLPAVLLGETPVELEVRERPTVNLVQEESWVEPGLRYLTEPRKGQRVRNELYRRILVRFGEEPERVKFPVGRNR